MSFRGPYTLVAKLGEGGMAEVFKAVKQGPEGFEKPIALKRILPFYADHPTFLKMLASEARVHAHLDHPNIVQILDFFRQRDHYLIALEYVPGKNLRQIASDARRKRDPISWQASVYIVSEVLKGLEFAHKRRGTGGPLGIVHRDVSPQNILVSYEGLVKLPDFGIARARIEQEDTKSGVLKGKERYAAPEQFRTSNVDFRADLFAAGMVLYELVTSRIPSREEITQGRVRPPKEFRPELPAGIDEVILRSLTADPSARHSCAQEYRDQLLSAADPDWLSHGTERLRDWLTSLYPMPADRQEGAIHDTPVLSLDGTPLPVLIHPTRSLISGVAEISWRNVRRVGLPRRPVWVVATLLLLSLAAVVFSVGRSVRPKESPPSRTPATTTDAVLRFEGPDGATIFVNGQAVGHLPSADRPVQSGSYVVLLRDRNGVSSMTRIQLKSGDNYLVRFTPPKRKK
ncbi:MAG: serine/threonine-protein kinase [Pseudomonadota bacterium]